MIELLFYYDVEKKKMKFPKTTYIKDALIQFLKETHSKIDLSCDKIIFIYINIKINNEKNLNKRFLDLKLKNKIKVKVVDFKDIYGNGGKLVDYCDIDNEKEDLTSNPQIGKNNGIAPGINIFSNCNEKNCYAFNKEIIIHVNKNNFNYINEKHNLKCPKCNNNIIPVCIGFNLCEYKVYGKKEVNGSIEEFNFKETVNELDKIDYYNLNENDTQKERMIELNFEIIKFLNNN